MATPIAGPTAPSVSPGLAAFILSVSARRVAGSPASTAIAFFLLTLSLADLTASVFGRGGVIALSIQLIGPAISPSRATVYVFSILLHGAALALGMYFLTRSPWRRWLGPSLRANLPLRGAWSAVRALLRGQRSHAGAEAPQRQRALLQFVALVVIFLVVRPVTADFIGPSSGEEVFVSVLTFAFAYLATWVVGTFFDNAIRRQGARTSGDWATAMGIVVALLLTLPAIVAVSPAHALLSVFGFSDAQTLGYREANFYAAIAVLITLVVFCLGSVSDSDSEELFLESNSPDVRIELPDCTGSEFSSFLFRVHPNDNQILLLLAPVSSPSQYVLLSTEDAHDLTAGRYIIVNFSALARRQANRITVGYGLMQGRFVCQLDLALTMSSVEAFISDLRRDGGAFPMEAFAVFADSLLVHGLQPNVFQHLFTSAMDSVESELMRSTGELPEIRTLTDTLTQAHRRAAAGFDEQVTRFQDANHSVLERTRRLDGARLALQHLGMERDSFMNQFGTLINSLRGEQAIATRVTLAVRQAASRSMDLLMQAYITDPVKLQQAQRFTKLAQISLLNAQVFQSPDSVRLEQQFDQMSTDIQQRHDRAHLEIRAISQRAGQDDKELVDVMLTNPSVPYGVRDAIGRLVLGAFSREGDSNGTTFLPETGRFVPNRQGTDRITDVHPAATRRSARQGPPSVRGEPEDGSQLSGHDEPF